LRGGDGGSLSKKDRIVPFFFFFFWVVGLVAFASETSTGISSSVAGGVDKEESESAMFAVWWFVQVVSEGAEERARQTINQARHE
jgi:hypothetical protein